MQPLLASTALAADMNGDAIWQGLWVGTTLKTILYSTIAAILICAWIMKSPLSLLPGAILGVIGNFFWVHVFQNKGDTQWDLLGNSDGVTFFVCIVAVAVLNLIFKGGWGGAFIGLGMAVFVDIFFVHWAMVWWGSMGGFSFSF